MHPSQENYNSYLTSPLSEQWPCDFMQRQKAIKWKKHYAIGYPSAKPSVNKNHSIMPYRTRAAKHQLDKNHSNMPRRTRATKSLVDKNRASSTCQIKTRSTSSGSTLSSLNNTRKKVNRHTPKHGIKKKNGRTLPSAFHEYRFALSKRILFKQNCRASVTST